MSEDYDVEDIKRAARKELKEEYFREAVDKEKTRLRNHVSFWDQLFPWRIVLVPKQRGR